MLFRSVNSFSESLDRLVDGDLPWGWHYANEQITEKIKSEHYNHPAYTNWDSVYKGDPYAEIEALKTYLQYIDELQARCDGMGECFGFWFAVDLLGEGRKEWLEERLAKLEKDNK